MGRTLAPDQIFFFFSFRACSQLGDDPSDPEDFSGFGGNVRGFPSPGTLQDLERCTEDSFWLDLLSVISPSSAERFRERSLAFKADGLRPGNRLTFSPLVPKDIRVRRL